METPSLDTADWNKMIADDLVEQLIFQMKNGRSHHSLQPSDEVGHTGTVTPKLPRIQEDRERDELKMPALTLKETDLNISEPNEESNEPLPLPYSGGSIQKIKYYFESFLVVHPRVYGLLLLYQSTWPRVLVVFDMYTDFVVAYGLYKGIHSMWFMLSCLFITLPFVLVWVASLRFIQSFLKSWFTELKTQPKKRKWMQPIINFCLMIYMFPLIGSLCIAFYEIYWVLSDIFNGWKSFFKGTGFVEAEDQQVRAMKAYREAVEIFAEGVPQTMLQLYIFIRVGGQQADIDDIGIERNDLYLSLGVSLLNLCLSLYKFRAEAKLHGMSWAEYALSVLQLAEVPVITFVPRLPAIRKGYIDEVNFSGFVFDSESIAPLLDGVNATTCKLHTMKLSVASFSKLNFQTCEMVGSVLSQSKLKVLLTRTSSLSDIHRLFESIDTGGKGYWVEDEFLTALMQLNCSLQHAPIEKQKLVFKRMAIRRLKQRDRVYFYDFFHQSAKLEHHIQNLIDFDLTQIEYPLQFITDQILHIIENNKILSEKYATFFIQNMKKLYYFCKGMSILKQIDATTQQHALFSVIEVFYMYENSKRKKHMCHFMHFISFMFEDMIKSEAFDATLLFARNNVFQSLGLMYLNILEDVKPFATALKSNGYSGYNIFEYCFLYSKKQPKCKQFELILNKLLLGKTQNGENIENLIRKKGQLYDLFKATNNFHIFDAEGKSPLMYAAENCHPQVIEFFVKFVFHKSKWAKDQIYLQKILSDLLSTKSITPTTVPFELLLGYKEMQTNYMYKSNDVNGLNLKISYIGNNILTIRNTQLFSAHRKYWLECLQVLLKPKFNYDCFDNVNEIGNNLLHATASSNDHEAVTVIVQSQKTFLSLSKLLNATNDDGMCALDIALHSNYPMVAETLMNVQGQIVDLGKYMRIPMHVYLGKIDSEDDSSMSERMSERMSISFDPESEMSTGGDEDLIINMIAGLQQKKRKTSRSNWIKCLYSVIQRTNGKIFKQKCFTHKMKQELLGFASDLYQEAENRKNNNIFTKYSKKAKNIERIHYITGEIIKQLKHLPKLKYKPSFQDF